MELTSTQVSNIYSKLTASALIGFMSESNQRAEAATVERAVAFGQVAAARLIESLLALDVETLTPITLPEVFQIAAMLNEQPSGNRERLAWEATQLYETDEPRKIRWVYNRLREIDS